nr:hypothetical protein DA06_02720 [Georgenia sp. SUBG003]
MMAKLMTMKSRLTAVAAGSNAKVIVGSSRLASTFRFRIDCSMLEPIPDTTRSTRAATIQGPALALKPCQA